MAMEEVFPCLFIAVQVYVPSSLNVTFLMTSVEFSPWSVAFSGRPSEPSFLHVIRAGGSAVALHVSSSRSPASNEKFRKGLKICGYAGKRKGNARNTQVKGVLIKHHPVLGCAVLCCAALCCTALRCVSYAVFCFAVLCCVVQLCFAVFCCAVLCCAVLCCAVLCCAVLCCAVLCCAVLCCAVLCCAVLCCVVVRSVLCCMLRCCCAVLCLWPS